MAADEVRQVEGRIMMADEKYYTEKKPASARSALDAKAVAEKQKQRPAKKAAAAAPKLPENPRIVLTKSQIDACVRDVVRRLNDPSPEAADKKVFVGVQSDDLSRKLTVQLDLAAARQQITQDRRRDVVLRIIDANQVGTSLFGQPVAPVKALPVPPTMDEDPLGFLSKPVADKSAPLAPGPETSLQAQTEKILMAPVDDDDVD